MLERARELDAADSIAHFRDRFDLLAQKVVKTLHRQVASHQSAEFGFSKSRVVQLLT